MVMVNGVEVMKKVQNVISVVTSALIFLVFFYFIGGQIFFPADAPKGNYECEEYTGQWQRVFEDGTRQPVQIPGSCEADRNEKVVLETQLPEGIEAGKYLCFRSAKQDMNFYIDGNLRTRYSTEKTRFFGNMSAVVYIFLEMEEGDAGNILQVETQTDSSYSGIFYQVYSGTQMGIWGYLFQQYGVELIVACITLILSVVVIVGSMAFHICYRSQIPLQYLGWGILIAAMWLITNSTFRQLIFPNISTVNDMTFLMIMLLALPYLLYMDAIQKGRYRMGYFILECVVAVNFVGCSLLHMTGLCDFTDTISYVCLFCVISIVWLLLTIIIDVIRGKVQEYPFVAVGMFGVCVAAFIQIIIYFHRINSFNGVILAVGLIFLLVFSTVNTICEIVVMDREKQQAITASEAKGRFLAQMSHEIRTPIHAVLGMDEMILRECRDSHIREYALDIQNAGQTLLSLINDILDISKIESGKLEVLPVEYDFSSLIHDVVNMMEMKVRDKGLDFHVLVEKEIPSRLYGDDVRLRQILVNLLGNAVKYTEKGSVSLKVKYRAEGDCAYVSFFVEDTGIGIREKDMEKLFREFERIEEERNRNIEGTGLGMSISIQLLDMMDSKLHVESVYGEGSVFSFTVCQKIMSAEPVGDLEQRIRKWDNDMAYEAQFVAPEADLLIVDDNGVNRKVFSNLLKETQIRIDEAASGMQCLEKIEHKKYDLIFMDHMMPEMDGVETLHKMRENGEHLNTDTPVIALTANAVTGAREMYLQEGFCDFLSKPVNPEKLENLIGNFLPKEKIIYNEDYNTMAAETPDTEEIHFSLQSVEGIDWEYGLSHCKNEHILTDTVKSFYETMESEARGLEAVLDEMQVQGKDAEDNQKDISSFRIKVHSMKSAAAMIGAVSVSGLAWMLEGAAKKENVDEIKKLTPYFLEEWRKLRQNLSAFVEESEPDKVPLDISMCITYLNLLPGLMENMDVDAADEVISQLRKYAYPTASMEEDLKGLCEAVAELEDEKTLLYCNRLLQSIGKMGEEQ